MRVVPHTSYFLYPFWDSGRVVWNVEFLKIKGFTIRETYCPLLGFLPWARFGEATEFEFMTGSRTAACCTCSNSRGVLPRLVGRVCERD